MYSVKVKLNFKGDDANHYVDLVFRHGGNIKEQIQRWVSNNMKNVERWEIVLANCAV